MRAAIINAIGDVPVVGEFPAPTAGPGEVVVDVTLAGLNPVDRLRAEGYEYLSPVPPFVAGREGVGVLDGERVYFHEAVEPYGSFAKQALVSADEILKVPAGITDEQAIPLGVAGLTAWVSLSYDAELVQGERVLVIGATGMVGQIAVQAAKLLGASYVVGAGRHEETLASLRDRGADEVVVLGGDPGPAIAAVAGDGFDVVVDCVFGPPFVAALSATAPGARVVVVGLTAGTNVNLEFFSLYRRRISGLQMSGVPRAHRQEAFDAMAEHTLAGGLRVDAQRYELDDVATAWGELLRGAHRKLLIAP
jgi:NADPH:quinone reductase-like Zn-dependent oxidoreductase